MCGETVRGIPKLVRVEGAELQVCSKCEKYGTEVQQRRGEVKRPAVPRSPGAPAPGPVTQAGYRKRDLFDYMGGEIVEDYADQIKKARMERGLSQKDLAMQMKEKEHLLKKIENGELIPEDDVRKKIEKALGIRLVDAPAKDAEKKIQNKLAPTLGDVTIIRKVKK
ncbi:MAG: multiprotein bridging factor aMBF1 [Methanoregula sp.]|nr:multiprotein bridging factor aMBF1 [Methanoregula sp.]